MIKPKHTLNEAQKQALSAYCATLLAEFCSSANGIESATFATFDGITLASTIEGKTEGDKMSAMSSSMAALAAALTREVKHAEPDRVMFESGDGHIIFMTIPTASIVFTAVTDNKIILGTLRWNCRNTIQKLASYVAQLGG